MESMDTAMHLLCSAWNIVSDDSLHYENSSQYIVYKAWLAGGSGKYEDSNDLNRPGNPGD